VSKAKEKAGDRDDRPDLPPEPGVRDKLIASARAMGRWPRV
jgi:hypothetical protein